MLPLCWPPSKHLTHINEFHHYGHEIGGSCNNSFPSLDMRKLGLKWLICRQSHSWAVEEGTGAQMVRSRVPAEALYRAFVHRALITQIPALQATC